MQIIMKKSVLSLMLFLGYLVSVSFVIDPPIEEDYTDCLEKIGSDWGENCPDCKVYRDSYRVKLKNNCPDSVDVMICVQEASKEWKRFMFHAMAPGDSMIAYACEGTGKYMKWAKKAGDKSYTFPSIDEVNAKYKD